MFFKVVSMCMPGLSILLLLHSLSFSISSEAFLKVTMHLKHCFVFLWYDVIMVVMKIIVIKCVVRTYEVDGEDNI